MPAKCHFCETGTHSDFDKEQFPKCVRNFITRSEAWALIAENKSGDETIHVMANPQANILIGADWSRNAIKELLERAKYIERCEPTGTARGMKHGIAVMDTDNKYWFVETDENTLKAYEELHFGE